MNSFLQQVFTLLTTDTGSLTYHLVLAFSIAGALQASLGYWHSQASSQSRRLIAGLSLLLVFRLVLFAGAGLAWQGLVIAHPLLPALDRAVTLLSLLVIIWLWNFPQPSRGADTAAILVALLTLTLLALGAVWLTSQSSGNNFNGSQLDTLSEIYALALIVIGALLLLIRQTPGWGFGLAMFALFFIGHLAYLISPIPDGDYPGAVRLFQMAAYPLLFILHQRSAAPEQEQDDRMAEKGVQPASPVFGSQLLEAVVDLAEDPGSGQVCQSITYLVAQAMQADLCLLLSLPDPEGNMAIRCGYDLHHREYLDGIPLDSRSLPILSTTLSEGRPLRLPSAGNSPDLFVLARVLDLSRPSNLLAVPIPESSGGFSRGLLLLSPYSNHAWTSEQQADLINLARSLSQVAGRAPNLDALQQAFADSQAMLAQAQQDRANLQEQLNTLHLRAGQDRSQLQSLAAVLAAQGDAQESLQVLQAENESLRQATLLAPAEGSEAGGELRLALEEVALLRNAIAEANQKIQSLTGQASISTTEPALSKDKAEVIFELVQELRQPLASVANHTKFLLDELAGSLTSHQRKFLDRVKISTERMGRMIDDLIQITNPENAQFQLAPEPVDLKTAFHDAVIDFGSQLGEKNIPVQLDIPEQLPPVQADREALRKILIRLLSNAAGVNPAEVAIQVRVRPESRDGQTDYVLTQVIDSGGGIPPEDLAHIFSQVYRPDQSLVQGVSESGLSLSTIKALVEALGGRIWVDSRPGQGSTFNLLLPVAASKIPLNGGSEALA